MQDKRSVSYSHQNHLHLYSTELQAFLVLFLASVVGGSPGTTLSKGGEILFRSWVAMNPFLHAVDPLWLNC